MYITFDQTCINYRNSKYLLPDFKKTSKPEVVETKPAPSPKAPASNVTKQATTEAGNSQGMIVYH